ncbi:MAG: hypothetical protein WCF90_04360 [Methanomicrobiales archaeon]
MVQTLFEKCCAPLTTGIALLAIIAVILLLSVTGILPPTNGPVQSSSSACHAIQQNVPVFPAHSKKIAALEDLAFTGTLSSQVFSIDPLIASPGTQVYMGFWSGKGNHGSMLLVLDAIKEGPYCICPSHPTG